MRIKFFFFMEEESDGSFCLNISRNIALAMVMGSSDYLERTLLSAITDLLSQL